MLVDNNLIKIIHDAADFLLEVYFFIYLFHIFIFHKNHKVINP